jgi:hypothetical protein
MTTKRTMLTFKGALRRHGMLKRKVTDENRALAEQIYAGVTGRGTIDTLEGHSIADTVPQDFAVLLMTDDIPAAAATAIILETFESKPTPQTPREARLIAHEGWARFRKLAEEVRETDKGGDLSEAWPRFAATEKMDVHSQEKLREIADLAGRMLKALKGAKQKKATAVPEEVVGVRTGAEIEALLPQEYAMLGMAPTEMEAFRRLEAGETQQFERRGTESMARGALAIAIDESGSMNGQENVWAKAAATALTRMAWEDKRDVVWVHFSTATRVNTLKPGDVAGLVKAQNSFMDGGTDIGTAVQVAADEIKDLGKRGQKGADAVVISDGGDAGYGISNAIDELDGMEAKLFSIAIGPEFTGQLKDRSAKYVHLDHRDMRSTKGATAVGGAVGA